MSPAQQLSLFPEDPIYLTYEERDRVLQIAGTIVSQRVFDYTLGIPAKLQEQIAEEALTIARTLVLKARTVDKICITACSDPELCECRK